MGYIKLARKFYSLPRITAEDRKQLFAMLHDDIHYVGLGKDDVRGKATLEALYRKYHDDKKHEGVTSLTFDIRNVAENGNSVLLDMRNTFVIAGNEFTMPFSIVLKFDEKTGLINYWQEHYDLATFYKFYGEAMAEPQKVAHAS
jgi:limonene-1,2-epoxide hydrolase